MQAALLIVQGVLSYDYPIDTRHLCVTPALPAASAIRLLACIAY